MNYKMFQFMLILCFNKMEKYDKESGSVAIPLSPSNFIIVVCGSSTTADNNIQIL